MPDNAFTVYLIPQGRKHHHPPTALIGRAVLLNYWHESLKGERREEGGEDTAIMGPFSPRVHFQFCFHSHICFVVNLSDFCHPILNAT